MHILEIPSFFTPYGGEFCLEQAKALQEQGHEVRILSNVQLGMTIGLKGFLSLPFCRYEHQEEGITVCQSFQRGLPHMVRHNAMRWISIVQSMFEEYVQKYGQPDILHAHCSKWAGYAAMLISQKYHLPYVVTEHLSWLEFERELGPSPSSAWQIPLLKKTYEQADMVIPVSEELVDAISCYFGKDYRWQHLSNVIDTDFFHFAEREPRNGRPFRFCCIADYSYRKGYDVLLDACRLLEDWGCDMELHIAGRMTDGKDCQAAIAQRKLTHIVSHGQLSRNAVRDLLYQSDSLVLASRSEVQPLVVLEAMSTGIPVVATESVPSSERLKGACRIVPVEDATALAEAMQELMTDYSQYDGADIARQTRALASPEVIGRKLSELFTQVKG